MKRNKILVLSLLAGISLPSVAQTDSTSTAFADQTVDIGANKTFTVSQSTASVSVISNKTTDRRSAKNIGNSIIGQGNGLVSIQNAGLYGVANPTFYVRGLQSLSSSSPLVLVDGIERDINAVSPEEVENVSILKDAAAVALYGYKGVNGVIVVTTKRGKYDSKEVKFTYDHVVNYMSNRPKFVNAYTYANAMNEALANDGLDPRYSAEALDAFRNGTYPQLYPNVNWVDETFRNHGVTNKYAIEFTGGAKKFRYYTMVNLLSDKGFIKNFDQGDYSTQDKFVKANLRINLDVDLTPTTKMKVTTFGSLNEMSRPGSAANLWDKVYTLPSAAYPVRLDDGTWGGSSVWDGTMNPVAQSQAAAYYKVAQRTLFTDMQLDQDLSGLLKGLSVTGRLGYDTYSNIVENYSKTYVYGSNTVTSWTGGQPAYSLWTGGADSEMGTGSSTNSWARRLHFDAAVNFDRQLTPDHYVYSQLKYDYEFQDADDVNTTVYRHNVSLWSHYAYKNRYIADLALMYSGSSRLAPGTKWNFSPTLSAAWVASNEAWLKNVSWINMLKLRASAGMINADYLPDNSVWTYYRQAYEMNGVIYPFNNGYDSSFGSTLLGRLATENPTQEKAYKYNVGVDATLFDGLDVQLDAYYQHRTDIWVDASGKYTDVLGFDAPYENGGVVDSWGFEASLDYNKRIGQVDINIGGNFSLNKNKVKEQYEEPQLYANTSSTNRPLSQLFGLKAIGFFKDQADIDASPTQAFTTVRPGDIKYEDVNKDGKIDTNDRTAIGYNIVCPEIYYSFHLGAEWKGLGFYAMFQGTGNYTGVMNTKSMYWPLVNNTTISQYAYDNRWTPETAETAKFPRLSSSSNANNYQTSTLWMFDRSFLKLRNIEVYYNLPKSLLAKTKIVNAAKIYVRGTDLFCLDHLDEGDAESYGATNPLTKSVVAGLSITF